jgi:hypothetical protein
MGCSYFNCTANTSGITESFEILTNGTLAGSGSTAPGSRDFSSTAVLKGIGQPGQFENETLISYLDGGAIQRPELSPVAGCFGGGNTLLTM